MAQPGPREIKPGDEYEAGEDVELAQVAPVPEPGGIVPGFNEPSEPWNTTKLDPDDWVSSGD